ncbi:hypothetical protein F5Y18DRAFT_427352 [Xylariaceae sp. FL1019]|nr:hypothetical protein F5Y18DRAFT_427352 [Xylariaceae sp. FL1019]
MSALLRARQTMLGNLPPVTKVTCTRSVYRAHNTHCLRSQTTTSRTISWMAFEQPNPALYTHLGSTSHPGSTTDTAMLAATTTDTKPVVSVECKTQPASDGPKIRSPGQVVAPAVTTSTLSPFSKPQKRTIHSSGTPREYHTLNIDLQLKLDYHPATWPVQQPEDANVRPCLGIRQNDLCNYPPSAVWGWEEWKRESPLESGDPAQGPAKRLAEQADTAVMAAGEPTRLRTLERKQKNQTLEHANHIPPDEADAAAE